MTWNLHIVGHADESSVQPLVADFIAAIEDNGYVLDSAMLTTDAGPVDVSVSPPPAEPVQTVGGEPVPPVGAAADPTPSDSTAASTESPVSPSTVSVPYEPVETEPEDPTTAAASDASSAESSTPSVPTDTPPTL